MLGVALAEVVPAPTYQDLVVYQASHENVYAEVQTALGGSDSVQVNPVLSIEGGARQDLNKVKSFYMPVLRNPEAMHPNAPLYGLCVLSGGNRVFVALDRFHLPIDIPVFTCIDRLGKIVQYELGASEDRSLLNKTAQVRKFNGQSVLARVDPRVGVPRSVVLQGAQDAVGLYDDLESNKRGGVVVNGAYATAGGRGGHVDYDVPLTKPAQYHQYDNQAVVGNSEYLLVGAEGAGARHDFEEEGEYMDVSRNQPQARAHEEGDYMTISRKKVNNAHDEGDYSEM